jgi:hypothetical protein
MRAADILSKALLSDSVGIVDDVEACLIELVAKDAKTVMDCLGNALLDKESGWRLQVSVLSSLVANIPCEIVMEWVRRHGVEGARRLARHLPPPHVDAAGQAVVPQVLDEVLGEFGDDDVLSSFFAGSHSGAFWAGNASERFRSEAEEARKFLSHRNPRIREWAKREISYKIRMAELEDREHAEQDLPD